MKTPYRIQDERTEEKMRDYVARYMLNGERFQQKRFKAKDRSEARRIALQWCPSPLLEVECYEVDVEKYALKERVM